MKHVIIIGLLILNSSTINFTIYTPINVLPVPGGPYINAIFFEKVYLNALS